MPHHVGLASEYCCIEWCSYFITGVQFCAAFGTAYAGEEELPMMSRKRPEIMYKVIFISALMRGLVVGFIEPGLKKGISSKVIY